MYSTSDLKRGLIIELDGAPHLVENVTSTSPTARGANTIHKVKMRNLINKQRVEKSFRGGDNFGMPDVDLRAADYLYEDQTALHFMDKENFEQFAFNREDLEWESKFLTEGLEGIRAFYFNGSAIAIELPNTIVLEITETAPGAKGNSATGRTKPATLQTGHVVQLPEHFEAGARVNVDSRTGEYLSRAK